MTPEQAEVLLHQHELIFSQFERVWVLLFALVLLGIVLVVIVLLAAAWSVNKVLARQANLETNHVLLTKAQEDLTGKFALLIDVLLKGERIRRGSDPV